jgi:hypothetical protein
VIRTLEQDDAVEMIRHHCVGIERDWLKFLRQLQPSSFNHFASVAQRNPAA